MELKNGRDERSVATGIETVLVFADNVFEVIADITEGAGRDEKSVATEIETFLGFAVIFNGLGISYILC